MNDFESAKFDDELLSAYLDNELAPAERARVEAHLASDPSARQLLSELRAVSQSLKNLPAEKLETDLREAVLRRAERAMLVRDDGNSPHASHGHFTRLPFGRTKRAWFWAGTAIAAGLLLMVYPQIFDEGPRLPREVAKRDRAAIPEIHATSDALEIVAEEGLSTEPAAPSAQSPRAFRAKTVVGDAERFAGGAAGERQSTLAGAPAEAAAEGPAVTVSDGESELLVVHLNVAPAAFRGRAIDHVLERNQIEFEPQADPSSDKSIPTTSPPGEPDVDVLLLEAAPEQIMSTLADLDADRANYFGIEVDDSSTVNRRVSASKDNYFDFRQHNRGLVPIKQKLAITQGRADLRSNTPPQSDSELLVRRQLANEYQDFWGALRTDSKQGRAMRLAPPSVDGSAVDAQDMLTKNGIGYAAGASRIDSLDAPVASDDSFAFTKNRPAGESQPIARRGERLQALFLLTPGEAPAAAEPAATPPLPQEGLKKASQ